MTVLSTQDLNPCLTRFEAWGKSGGVWGAAHNKNMPNRAKHVA